MQDFTKGSVQGKRRHLERAVTHHPFHSQALELIRPNLEYCEDFFQLSFENCRVTKRLSIGGIFILIDFISNKMHDIEFLLPAGIESIDNYKVKVRVIPHAFLETFYHLRNLLSLVLGYGSNQLKHYANMNPI